MSDKTAFDIIIIGGSYAGLSAAMALGRSLRRVLIIDSGKPCNRQTPYSHNFLTQDGQTPAQILDVARQQVARYDTVSFYDGLAIEGVAIATGFTIKTDAGDTFSAKKLIFATGISDNLPDIEGFAECWGISVIHCPYCHGYEVRNEPTGLLGKGGAAFEMVTFISNWTKDLTLFTNGDHELSDEQLTKLDRLKIRVETKTIKRLVHDSGQIRHIAFDDDSQFHINALYARVGFSQHCSIPQQLGCGLTENGYIQADQFGKTAVPGVFVCGDNTNMMRSVANAVGTGSMAGAMANREFIQERLVKM